ncbi:MAG: hypothetical protein ACR2H3_02735 [Acidimicrobiales bacterium]
MNAVAPNDRLNRWAWPAAAGLASLPIVVATARAIGRGWAPIGDNALFLIRARDVLTEHHPLLGTWTSASISVGRNLNNPGPLYFDLLAAPAKIGGGAGLAVGAAALNVICVTLAVWLGHRMAGAVGAAGVGLLASALGWSMGSELLFDPWQPHGLLFPVLLFFVAAWALMAGDGLALPLAVGTGSLLVQTHLSYSIIVPVVGAIAAAMAWRNPRSPGLTRRLVFVTAVVVGVCWGQSLWQQVAGPGGGNLTAIASSVGAGTDPPVGLAQAGSLNAEILATAPWIGRPSFRDAFQPADLAAPVRDGKLALVGLPSPTLGWAALLGLLLLTGILGWRRHRAGDRVRSSGAVLGSLLLVLSLVTTAIVPITRLGLSAHQLRFLWPVFLIVAATVSGSLLAEFGDVRLLAGSRVAVVGLLAASAAAAAALAPWNPMAGPAADSYAIPIVDRLAEGLDGLPAEPILFDLTTQRFAEPYTTPLMAALQERGVDFRVVDEGMVAQLGPARRATGRESSKIVVLEGDLALSPPHASRRLSFVAGLNAAERAELENLRGRILASPNVGMTARYLELEERWTRQTVGVFLVKVDAR